MKQKYAKLDETGRVQFAVFSSAAEAAEQGYLPYEEEDKPTTPEGVIPYNYSPQYVEQDNKIIRQWQAYPNYEEIEKLKEKLTESDYKVIKCYEVSLVGGTLPYDSAALHEERQAIRDEINRLEACE